MTIKKLLFALAGTVALGLQTALADDHMSTEDWVIVIAATLAAYGTWLVPNTPELRAAKTWVSALVLGAGVLVPLLAHGLTQQEVWTCVIAVLTSAGVYVMPKPDSDVPADDPRFA